MGPNITDDEFPNQLSSVIPVLNCSVDYNLAQELRHRNNLWRSNYHEASIYIEEGLNNDKFENHPRKRATLANSPTPNLTPDANQAASPVSSYMEQQKPYAQQSPSQNNGYLQYTTIETYILVHNRYFYQLDLIASIVLLLLAIVEPPAVEGYELNPNIHTAVEIVALVIIAIELLLKFRWMGPKRFFRHGRTITKLTVLLTMTLEAIVILLRHSTHARYSRALRPIFLIDNHYCHGIRRAIRQIFQSLPPILDMFTLALFFMFVFSIFGFYLFASHNVYFSDIAATTGNLLVLATTANLPDIMLPSYAISRWSTIFFVLFIIVHLFLLTNLTMATVYESFTRREKEKFHKLLLHRRKACQEAFKLLVSQRQPKQIQYRQFMGLMRYLNRKCSMFNAYLIFKALDTDKNGSISLEEFYQIYDVINLEWKLIYPETTWFDTKDYIPSSFKYLLRVVQKVVNHKYFEWTVDIMIATQAILQFIEAAAFDIRFPTKGEHHHLISPDVDQPRPDSVSTAIFICIFTIEAFLRCLALGLSDYWKNRWNRFDLLVLTISICGLLSGHLGTQHFGWVVVLRVLRLTRVFEFKRRYRDIWQTLTYILLKRFVSMTCVVMILYYFFAIIGMELLGQYDLRDCCKNSSLESQFKFDNSTESAKYYLNDFSDIVASYLTLFSMTSNTCWLAVMNAYSIVTENNWIRFFFAFYYLCSLIVLNIVVAFILESFLFRIHYRNKMGDKCDDTNLFSVRVTLSSSEVDFIRKNLSSHTAYDENLVNMLKIVKRRRLISNSDDEANEKVSLIPKSGNKKTVKIRPSNAKQDEPTLRRWYLIYQANQIRNKFSFTMKMYAEEVEEWLSEAERANQDEVGAMISRNQLRAEHVAMARLVRRSIAAAAALREDIPSHTRGRSWSSSGGLIGDERTSRPTGAKD